MAAAHSAIFDYVMDHNLSDAPRTTCVACVIQDDCAYWAHVGDSRLYLLRDDHIYARTHDHSRVQMMVDKGLMTEEQALQHPDRNRVYSCLGGNVLPQIDLSQKTPLLLGDTLVLCTDGFWAPLGSEALVQGYVHGSVMAVTPHLMDMAEKRGGAEQDNLSVIAVTWEEAADGDPSTIIIETQTMPLDAHTTLMAGFEKTRQRDTELTDDDIEQAIKEIRNAINKYSK
jgi:serine/threonine protein phosphatase PrpC